MDLKDLLKEYWPIVVGVVVALLTAVIFWPSDESPAEEPDLVPLPIVSKSGSPSTPNTPRDDDESTRAATHADREQAGPRESGEYEFIEIVNAVPVEGKATPARKYETNDPEVQRALAKVEVTLYVEDECASCASAREYLEKNGVLVTTHNVDQDSNQRERARRLSGGRSLPVLVVDEKVLPGFSEGSVQAALTDAVKTRVESEVKKQPSP